MTATQELADVEEDLSQISPDDPTQAGHYYRIEHLDAFAMGELSEVVALCGYKTTSIFKPINGRPVCNACKFLYEQALVD